MPEMPEETSFDLFSWLAARSALRRYGVHPESARLPAGGENARRFFLRDVDDGARSTHNTLVVADEPDPVLYDLLSAQLDFEVVDPATLSAMGHVMRSDDRAGLGLGWMSYDVVVASGGAARSRRLSPILSAFSRAGGSLAFVASVNPVAFRRPGVVHAPTARALVGRLPALGARFAAALIDPPLGLFASRFVGENGVQSVTFWNSSPDPVQWVSWLIEPGHGVERVDLETGETRPVETLYAPDLPNGSQVILELAPDELAEFRVAPAPPVGRVLRLGI